MEIGTGPSCPKCGSLDSLPVAYGFPGPEMEQAAERGEIVLGGCIIDAGSPAWECRSCRHRYNLVPAYDSRGGYIVVGP